MGVSVRTLAPALVAAAVLAGGAWIQSGWAQPATSRPAQPVQPAQPGQPGRPPGPPGGPGGPGGPGRMMNLEGAMRMMNRGFRELNANIADASKRDENLSAVWMMQQGCAAAKRGKPEHMDGDPAAGLETFRREQIKLMGMLIDLEAAIMDNKTDDAKAVLAKIKAFQKESHDKYKVKEREEGDRGGPGGPGGPEGQDGPGDRPPPPPADR